MTRTSNQENESVMELFKEECCLKGCYADTLETLKICGVEVPLCAEHEEIRNRCYFEEKTKAVILKTSHLNPCFTWSTGLVYSPEEIEISAQLAILEITTESGLANLHVIKEKVTLEDEAGKAMSNLMNIRSHNLGLIRGWMTVPRQKTE